MKRSIECCLWNLKSLDGINNISPGSINGMHIYMNDSLSDCSFTNIRTYLADSLGPIIIYSNASGCADMEEILEGCTVSLGEHPAKHDDFFIHPNPAGNVLCIASRAGKPVSKVVIYDQTGQVVLSNNRFFGKTEISELRKGLYFVEITPGILKQGRNL